MKFKPLFNPSVMTFSMVVPDMQPCTGIQKICGFTRGLQFHQVDYFPYWHISNSIVLGCNRASMQHPVKLSMYAYVDGKNIQKPLGNFEAGDKVSSILTWNKYECSAFVECGKYHHIAFKATGFKTLPFGWLLRNYAEIDNTNNKTPFHCQVEDLRVNGSVVKI